MVNFFCFAVSRYCNFFSHLASFLAGLSLLISLPFGLVCLALAIVLGSLSAFLRARSFPPSPAPADVSDMLADMFQQLSNHP